LDRKNKKMKGGGGGKDFKKETQSNNVKTLPSKDGKEIFESGREHQYAKDERGKKKSQIA